MKRQLLQTVRTIPYFGDAIPTVDRGGFLSAVFAVSIGAVTGSPTVTKIAVSVQDSATEDGAFTEVADPFKIVGEDIGVAEANRLYNVDIDLLACKRFIKVSAVVSFEGGTNPSAASAYALALGDSCTNPA